MCIVLKTFHICHIFLCFIIRIIRCALSTKLELASIIILPQSWAESGHPQMLKILLHLEFLKPLYLTIYPHHTSYDRGHVRSISIHRLRALRFTHGYVILRKTQCWDEKCAHVFCCSLRLWTWTIRRNRGRL